MISIKNILSYFAPITVGVVILIGVFIFLTIGESNYDFTMFLAEKKQNDFPEYVNFYGEIEPRFPDKLSNARTILGIDADQNMIRDDIDVWINRTAYDQNETKAMRQYARAKQVWLLTCEKQNLKDINVVLTKLAKAGGCLSFSSDYQRKIQNYAKDKLELWILNTKSRQGCNEFYSKLVKPKIKLTNDVAKSYCEFEILDFSKVVLDNLEWNKRP